MYHFCVAHFSRSIRLISFTDVIPMKQVPQAARQLSAMWKEISPEERQKWEEKAKIDRERYDVEKSIYDGPWDTQDEHKRCKKDESAPKRPMSAYLDYSKTLRTQVIRDNPHVKDNKEISKILGKMWNTAPEHEKRPFIERERRLRAEYNEQTKLWREERDRKVAEERSQREARVYEAIDSGTSDQLIKSAEVSRLRAKADKAISQNHHNFRRTPLADSQTSLDPYNRPFASHYHNSYTSVNDPFPMERGYPKYSNLDTSSLHEGYSRAESDQQNALHNPNPYHPYYSYPTHHSSYRSIHGAEAVGEHYHGSSRTIPNEVPAYGTHSSFNTHYAHGHGDPGDQQDLVYPVPEYQSRPMPYGETFSSEPISYQSQYLQSDRSLNEPSRYAVGSGSQYQSNPLYNMPDHSPVNRPPNYSVGPPHPF